MESLASNDFYLLGLILLFPLVGAAINGLIGSRLPKQAVWFVACTSIGLSFVMGLISVATMVSNSEYGYVEESIDNVLDKERAAWIAKQRAAQAGEGEQPEDATAEGDTPKVPPESEAAAETVNHVFDHAKHGFHAPRLEYTVFDWIVSGDWAADGGYEPVEQFIAVESRHRSTVYHPKDNDQRGDVRHDNIGGSQKRLRVSGAHRFDSLKVRLGLTLDQLSAILVLIITGVGLLIHIYSIGYMRTDKSKARYFAYLNLFCFAMLLLVLGSNLVVLFIGWEGVGLCSYLLIGYYYDDHENADAGKKAFIVNRVGDFAFVLGMLGLFLAFGTFEFAELEAHMASGVTTEMQVGLLTMSAVLIFIGCTGKSAQIPLYVWLPDAMAGPTPVSALIHAATMVTAGVYLIARLNFLYIHTPHAMALVAVVGALTALFAASIALVQTDIKKVLAYSTVSQLGYMFLGVGVGAWWAAVFHLMTHAFFKALLFLGSGSVIDAMHHEQDIRNMGGLRKKMPVTAITFLIGCIAIAGVPLFSGFFSKDAILWYTFYNQNPIAPWLGVVLWVIGLITAGLTAFYMFRLYFLTFEGEPHMGEKFGDAHGHGDDDHAVVQDETFWSTVSESPVTMTVPLAVLAVLSVVGGYLGLPHVLNVVHWTTLEAFPTWLAPVLHAEPQTMGLSHSAEVAAEWALMLASVAVAGAGIFLAYKLYTSPNRRSAWTEKTDAGPQRVLLNKYYIDEFYSAAVVQPALKVGRYFYALIDKVLIDILIVRLAGWTYASLGAVLRYFQSGDLQRYAAYIVFGLMAVVYLVLLR